MKLKCLIVLLASVAIAQPQAPITWGETRLLMNAPSGINPSNGVFAYGHTLVLAGYWTYGNRYLTTACVSGDNGQTWSPWHTFVTPDSLSWVTSFAVTGTGLYACAPVQGWSSGLYHSTDLGEAWTAPSIAIPYLRIMETLGDTIWCVNFNSYGDSIYWTADGGQSYTLAGHLWLNQFGIDDLSISDSSMCLTSYTQLPDEYPYLTSYVLHAPRPNGIFAVAQRLNPSYYTTLETDIELDRTGIGMVISGARYSTPMGDEAIFLAITQDHGVTWSEPIALEPSESAAGPMLRHIGHEWMAAWFDTLISPPFVHWGCRATYSANNGRSWYPSSQVLGENMAEGELKPLDLSRDRVRIYEWCRELNEISGRYYLQWEGEIHRDTLMPVITEATTLPSTLSPNTVVTFAASATDNDSLWQMTVVLRQSGEPDSVIVPLAREGNTDYTAMWTVPPDSGVYQYSYRAEDMWEHVTSHPDSGWLSFAVEPAATSPSPALPRSFSLSIYPNPFNSEAVLTLDLPRRMQVSATLYDIVGRVAKVAVNETYPAGEHRVTISGSHLSSGVYFLDVHAGPHRATRKLLLLR